MVAMLASAAGAEHAPDDDEPECSYAAGLGSELEAVCRGIRNSFECARKVEAHQLARDDRSVSREGASLLVRTESGPVVRITDERTADEANPSNRSFSYLKKMPEIGVHLFAVQYWEGAEYLLVDSRTGARRTVRGIPLPSPDGARFATVSADPYLAAVGVQIWRVDRSGAELEWSVDAEDWWPDEPAWRSPSRFEVVRRAWSDEKIGSLALVREAGRWSERLR